MMTLSPTRPTLAMSTPAQRDVMPTPDSGGRRGDGVTRQTLARANGLAVDEARLGFAAAADAGTMRPLTAANAVKQQQHRNDAQPGTPALTLTFTLTLTLALPLTLALAQAPTPTL